MNWLILTILIPTMSVVGFLTTTPTYKLQKCTYHRAYKMNGAYCKNLDLLSVPATLKSNIEILDLTTNRIRQLKNDTFARYSNLRFLYLADNIIQTIESTVFEPLVYLEVLDLSLNVFTRIPSQIFTLPYLRKLYISDVKLGDHLKQDLEALEKPIRAPLNYLAMSGCDMTEMPNFGILPDLEYLNVSSNSFTSLTPKDLAQMCTLKVLDISDSFKLNEDKCKNKQLIDWLLHRQIELVPELYSMMSAGDVKDCPKTEIDRNDLELFEECQKHIRTKEQEKTVKKTWIIIAGCIGGFILLSVLFFCCMHRRNVRSSKKTKKEQKESASILLTKT